MATFNTALQKTLKWEGGKVNDPQDPGGKTNKGVTQRTYNQYYPGDVYKMTDYQCSRIYKIGYWDKIKGDQIKCQQVAELLFDFAVNSGVVQASKTIQRIVGVKEDGIIGPMTINAINSKDGKWLFDELKKAREQFYLSLNKPRFIKGWLNRLNSFK